MWIRRGFSIYFDFSLAIHPFYLIVPVPVTSGKHHLKGKGGGVGEGCNCHYSALLPSAPSMEEKTLLFHYKKGCRSAIDFVKKQGLINVPKTGIVLVPSDCLDNKEIKFYPEIPPPAKLLVTKVDHPL